MVTGLLNLATVGFLLLAGFFLIGLIYFLLRLAIGKKTFTDDKGNESSTSDMIKISGIGFLTFIFFMILCYVLANGFNSPMEVSRMAQEKSIQEKKEREERKQPEKTPEQIQAEINEQRIRNAKNWCSKLKSMLDAEEKNWSLFMNSDSIAEMCVIYDFMRDSVGSLPDIPNDSPEEIQSEMIEAKRLTESVFKSRIAVMDSLHYMAQDRENWYRYNEEIAEQTRIVYQDTKQKVNQIYFLLEDIRSSLE